MKATFCYTIVLPLIIVSFLYGLAREYTSTLSAFTNIFKKNPKYTFTPGAATLDETYTMPQVYPNFITSDEAQKIKEIAGPNLQDSTTVGSVSQPQIRKSKTAWISKSNPVARDIINRVCQITGKPFANCEDLQVVYYGPGNYYKYHNDSCCDNHESCAKFFKRGGQRLHTMLIYVNDGYEGGETHFPNLNKKFKPPQYSGVLFNSMNDQGDKCHPLGRHAGMPITQGEKWICNIWTREREFI